MADAFDVAWNVSKTEITDVMQGNYMDESEQMAYEDVMTNLENARTALMDFGEDSYGYELEKIIGELKERFVNALRPEDDSPAPPTYQGVAGFNHESAHKT